MQIGQFEIVIPQVGRGAISTSTESFLQNVVTGVKTEIVVINPTGMRAKGTLKIFLSDGDQVTLGFSRLPDFLPPHYIIGGRIDRIFDIGFEIPPFGSRTFTTGGSDPSLESGYAMISADVPVEATAVYRTEGIDGPLLEAGIGSTTGKILAVGSAVKIAEEAIDTGVAIVNISSQEAEVGIQFRDEEDGLVASTTFLLSRHQHVAKFLSELAPELADRDFRGLEFSINMFFPSQKLGVLGG